MKMIHLTLVGLVLFGLAHIARGADYVENDITQYGPTLGDYVEYVETIAEGEELSNALSYLQGLRHMWVFTFAGEGYAEAEELNEDVSFDAMLRVAAQCVADTPDLVLYDDIRLQEMKPKNADNFLAIIVHDTLLLQCRTWLKSNVGE